MQLEEEEKTPLLSATAIIPNKRESTIYVRETIIATIAAAKANHAHGNKNKIKAMATAIDQNSKIINKIECHTIGQGKISDSDSRAMVSLYYCSFFFNCI